MNLFQRSVVALSLSACGVAQSTQPPPELELQLSVFDGAFCELVAHNATTSPAQGIFFMPQMAVYVDPAHPAGAAYFAKYEGREFLLEPLPSTFAQHGLDGGRDYTGYPPILVPIEPVVEWHASQLLVPEKEFVKVREVGIPMLRGSGSRSFLADYARFDQQTAGTWKNIQAHGSDGVDRELLVVADMIELAVYRQSGGEMFGGDWATDNEEYYDFFALFESGAALFWIQLFGNRSGPADPAYPASDPEIDPDNELLVGAAGPYTLSAATEASSIVIQLNDGAGFVNPMRTNPVTVPFLSRPPSAGGTTVVQRAQRGALVSVPISARGPDVRAELRAINGPYRRWVQVRADGPGGSKLRIPLNAPIGNVPPGGGAPLPTLELARIEDAYGATYDVAVAARPKFVVLP